MPWIKPLTTARLIWILSTILFTEWRLGPLYPFAVGIALLKIGLALIYSRPWQNRESSKREGNDNWLVSAAFVGTVGISIAISLFRPFLTERYLIFTAPLATLALAILVVNSIGHRIVQVLAVVLLLSVCISGVTTALNPLYEDWKGVSAHLSDGMEDHDLIVYSSWLSQSPVEYYLEKQNPGLAPITVTEPAPDLDLSAIEQIWLVHCNRYEVETDHLEWMRSLMELRDSVRRDRRPPLCGHGLRPAYQRFDVCCTSSGEHGKCTR